MTADHLYNEPELLAQITAGQSAAFDRLYHHYNRKVYHYILSIVKSPHLAEDLLQEIFLKIWEGREQLPAVKNFGPYLFTVARNHAINVLKSAVRSQTVMGEILQHATGPEVDDEILSRDYERLIQKVLLKLPPRTREIYKKCKEQGRTYEEVAAELGISGNAVKRHVVNSIRVLRMGISGELLVLLVALKNIFF